MVKLAGRPLIYWSLKRISEQARSVAGVVVALPSGWTWRRLERAGAVPGRFSWQPVVVRGGSTRFESLKNCLKAIRQNPSVWADFVFVHDAARPLWPSVWIPRMLASLGKNPSASGVAPLVPVRETVKSVNGKMSTLDRREYLRASQTPQLVRLKDFTRALAVCSPRTNFLDEAQILELAGLRVLPFEGYFGNIKVTYPVDTAMLEGLLRSSHAHRSGV